MGSVDPGITIAVITGIFGIIGILVAASAARKRSAGRTAEAVAHISEPTETAVGMLLRQDAADALEMRAELKTIRGQLVALEVRAARLEERLKTAERRARTAEAALDTTRLARDSAMAEHKQIAAELAACRLELKSERES